MALDNWPLDADGLRKALGFAEGQGDEDDLTLFAGVASSLIDRRTGRDASIGGDPTLYVVDDKVPDIFVLAARETAKLWWQQSKNGPKGPTEGMGVVVGPHGGSTGVPMGADIPMKVAGWLSDYMFLGFA
jgi:hypothetical protein